MPRKNDEFVCIHKGDHKTTFVLIRGRKYAFAQFGITDVERPERGVWDIKAQAVPYHTNVRDARSAETVTISGESYGPRLYWLLRELIACSCGESVDHKNGPAIRAAPHGAIEKSVQ